ncbi:MAG: glycosyltransferase family 2 protein [Tunicatimonas sp.]
MVQFFWICLLLVLYTYLGYGLLLYAITRLKKPRTVCYHSESSLPEVTLIIAAYNEADFIAQKIKNSLELYYPDGRLRIWIVTDGSDDATPQIVEHIEGVEHFFQPERQGKIAAVNRVMPQVTTPVVVFTDANTLLNEGAVERLVRHFADETVGAVAGEKRVSSPDQDAASGAGEGFYWQYESALKRWDAQLYSVVGAAGELFAVRTDLFHEVPADTIIEDFYLTLSIARAGYRVAYEPNAYAVEGPSASVKEELKRKVRIAAGGIQAIVRLRGLLNPFRHGVLTFQYVSHRVLRWTIAPFALLGLLVSNAVLVWEPLPLFRLFFLAQTVFYTLAIVGWLLASQKVKIKVFFIPYYFCVMNYAVFAGIVRYLRGSQSVVWERAARATDNPTPS